MAVFSKASIIHTVPFLDDLSFFQQHFLVALLTLSLKTHMWSEQEKSLWWTQGSNTFMMAGQ